VDPCVYSPSRHHVPMLELGILDEKGRFFGTALNFRNFPAFYPTSPLLPLVVSLSLLRTSSPFHIIRLPLLSRTSTLTNSSSFLSVRLFAQTVFLHSLHVFLYLFFIALYFLSSLLNLFSLQSLVLLL
jgi:hypothetical protein